MHDLANISFDARFNYFSSLVPSLSIVTIIGASFPILPELAIRELYCELKFAGSDAISHNVVQYEPIKGLY